jgi:uncharacterized protein involved in exopolysaccharide biosynthesis
VSEAVFEYAEDERTLQDYLRILKRRKWYLLIPFVAIGTLAVVVTLMWPAVFTSQATILIEEQEVPREFVSSTISNFATQQIQVISQRILTSDSIARIADKFGLYRNPETGTRPPATLIAQAFRDSMHLELVSADVLDPRSGRAQEATIAFTLAFDHGDPTTAKEITNELVTLFLAENLRSRAAQAANTEAFLAAESESLRAELAEIETRLARFKQANEGALPELHQFNLTALDRSTSELTSIDSRLQALAKRKLGFEAELAQISRWATVASTTGDVILEGPQRLKARRAEYRQKAAVYKPNHPDLQRLKREIEDLELELGVGESRTELSRALTQKQAELTDLRSRYRDDSVQVRAAEREVATLEQQLVDLPAEPAPENRAPDNPTYILLDTQRKSLVMEEVALKERRKDLQLRVQNLEDLISRAPTIEKDYVALLREQESTQTRYREIRAREREAEFSESMEQESKGQRFVLLEPPNLPLAPSSPNRPVLILVGLILAAGSGIGLMLLMEMLDGAIQYEKQLAQITGSPPFAVVPYIETSEDMAQHRALRHRLIYAAITGGLVFAVFFHFFIKPLDVAWFMLMNRVTG